MPESGVKIVERDGLAMVQVAAWPATAEAACSRIAESWGVPPPSEPNNVAEGSRARILWLGPHRWLLVAPREPGRDAATEISALLPSDVASVVDLGAGRRVFAVSGPQVRRMLAKELPLDLDPARFPPGRCAQGSMAHVGVLLHASAKDTFELFVYRAFAQHFLEMLEDAALEFTAAGAAA